jgi:hypothetical protein
LLLVEQNANMALNAADYGYVLENGRIVMEDTCARLREKDDIKEFYLGPACAASGAGRRRRPGDEQAMTTGLWSLDRLQPRHDSVLAGDTMPALFWNAVAQRGAGLAAPEGAGHLAQLDLDADRRGGGARSPAAC